MTCTFPNCDCVRDNLPLCKKSSIHAIYPTKAGFVAKQRLYTEAELHAAIAAKNAQILDLIEALRRRTDGKICGCGVDNPTDVCLSHYDVIEAVVRNRVQAAIATAMMGAAEHLYQLMMDNSDEALQAQIDCLLADMTLDGSPNLAAYFRDKLIASIPTDATAALEAVKAQAPTGSTMEDMIVAILNDAHDEETKNASQ